MSIYQPTPYVAVPLVATAIMWALVCVAYALRRSTSFGIAFPAWQGAGVVALLFSAAMGYQVIASIRDSLQAERHDCAIVPGPIESASHGELAGMILVIGGEEYLVPTSGATERRLLRQLARESVRKRCSACINGEHQVLRIDCAR